MPKFEGRLNCEYVVEVEAEDKKSAEKKIQSMINEKGMPDENWEEAWSGIEVAEVLEN